MFPILILITLRTINHYSKLITHNLFVMPHYFKLGEIPHKRHTQFRKKDGTLYSEQLFSTEGFSNDYSLLYHCHPPTKIVNAEHGYSVAPEVAEEKMLK